MAHARLCEHAAQECWNEQTAEKLKRMARECLRAAREADPAQAAISTDAH